jgi:hypothetical protein
VTKVANTLHDMWGHLLEGSGGAQLSIGRSADLPKEALALHRLPYTFSTCQMTLALGFEAVLWWWIQWLHVQGHTDC